MTDHKYLRLAISIVICQGIGIAVGAITSSTIPSWYYKLKKPAFNPSTSLFGPLWAILYTLMGFAAFIVKGNRSSLVFYGVQLILNFLWTVLFFGLRSPFAALLESVSLWVAILNTTILFWSKESCIAYNSLSFVG